MEFKGHTFKTIDGGVTAARGFTAAGVIAGLKNDASLDLAVVFSKEKCSCAGLFTQNKVRGHSLEYCSENVHDGNARCVFINSGNANACIGEQGYKDAVEISRLCSAQLGITPDEVLTGSTGVIGYPLQMDKIAKGIELACTNLSKNGGPDAADAIMTTDTVRKEAAVEINIGGKTVVIGGMAKGSGMIHPDMATMIAVITTDAEIPAHLLKSIMKETADHTFNRISVDGDTSVCDKIILLSNGASGVCVNNDSGKTLEVFSAALEYVSRQLARMIVRDGEGATKLIEVNVINAADPESALLAARTIANSPLVKTAFNGEDANWGRILTAAGYSGACFKPSETSISIGTLMLFNKGTAVDFDESAALEILKENEIKVTVDFGEGQFSDKVWTCDFSHEYIEINAHYRT